MANEIPLPEGVALAAVCCRSELTQEVEKSPNLVEIFDPLPLSCSKEWRETGDYGVCTREMDTELKHSGRFPSKT
jgi:hypothetical protein